MPLSRRNIIQYKPEGVANIFAPIIRINGSYVNPENVPTASNGMDYDYVHYPTEPTKSTTVIQTEHQQNQQFMTYIESTIQRLFLNHWIQMNHIYLSIGATLFGLLFGWGMVRMIRYWGQKK